MHKFYNAHYDAIGLLILCVVLLVALSIYFLPTIIGRKKKHAWAIFFCNLFFGGTGVGWLICLIWAMQSE